MHLAIEHAVDTPQSESLSHALFCGVNGTVTGVWFPVGLGTVTFGICPPSGSQSLGQVCFDSLTSQIPFPQPTAQSNGQLKLFSTCVHARSPQTLGQSKGHEDAFSSTSQILLPQDSIVEPPPAGSNNTSTLCAAVFTSALFIALM